MCVCVCVYVCVCVCVFNESFCYIAEINTALWFNIVIQLCEWVTVTQLCLTLCDPMDYNLPGSSVHGILQAEILEWVAISFSSESSRPRDWTQVSCTAGRFFITLATRELNYTSIKIEYPWAELIDWGIQLRETWWVLFIATCRSLSELMKSPQIPLKVRMSLSVATHVLKTKVGKEARVLAATVSTLI